MGLSLWTTLAARRKGLGSKPSLLLSWLATTGAVTWHSNGHMAVMLLPPLIRQATEGRSAQRSLILWALLPSVMFVIVGLVAIPVWMMLTGLTPPVPSIAYPALTLLGFNFYFVAREARKVWIGQKENSHHQR